MVAFAGGLGHGRQMGLVKRGPLERKELGEQAGGEGPWGDGGLGLVGFKDTFLHLGNPAR